jgi:hypothetical protein
VFLAHETLNWAKRSKQSIIFLKLEFSKAYDNVSWDFLFKVLEKRGMSLKAILMIKLLFANAKAIMNLNDQLVNTFNIKRGIRQRCPMALTSSSLGEILNQLVKQVVERIWM